MRSEQVVKINTAYSINQCKKTLTSRAVELRKEENDKNSEISLRKTRELTWETGRTQNVLEKREQKPKLLFIFLDFVGLGRNFILFIFSSNCV
jgi:hypothetical protein